MQSLPDGVISKSTPVQLGLILGAFTIIVTILIGAMNWISDDKIWKAAMRLDVRNLSATIDQDSARWMTREEHRTFVEILKAKNPTLDID